MTTWMEALDACFQGWQLAATRYLDMYKEQPFFLKGMGAFLEQSLQFKKMADQVTDEIWRQIRLPTREDITRLQEHLNYLDVRLMELPQQGEAHLIGLINELRELKKLAVQSGLKIDSLLAAYKEQEETSEKTPGGGGHLAQLGNQRNGAQS